MLRFQMVDRGFQGSISCITHTTKSAAATWAMRSWISRGQSMPCSSMPCSRVNAWMKRWEWLVGCCKLSKLPCKATRQIASSLQWIWRLIRWIHMGWVQICDSWTALRRVKRRSRELRTLGCLNKAPITCESVKSQHWQNKINVVQANINHLPFITINRWYVYHSQMGGLWHCFNHRIRARSSATRWPHCFGGTGPFSWAPSGRCPYAGWEGITS